MMPLPFEPLAVGERKEDIDLAYALPGRSQWRWVNLRYNRTAHACTGAVRENKAVTHRDKHSTDLLEAVVTLNRLVGSVRRLVVVQRLQAILRKPAVRQLLIQELDVDHLDVLAQLWHTENRGV
jgi:hypothetical protein